MRDYEENDPNRIDYLQTANLLRDLDPGPGGRVLDPYPFHADPNPYPRFSKRMRIQTRMRIRIRIQGPIFSSDNAEKKVCKYFFSKHFNEY